MNATYYAKVNPVQPDEPLTLVVAGIGVTTVLNDWWEIELLTPGSLRSANGPTRALTLGRREAIQDTLDCVRAWASKGVMVELIIPVVMSDFFPEGRHVYCFYTDIRLAEQMAATLNREGTVLQGPRVWHPGRFSVSATGAGRSTLPAVIGVRADETPQDKAALALDLTQDPPHSQKARQVRDRVAKWLDTNIGRTPHKDIGWLLQEARKRRKAEARARGKRR